MDEISGIGQGMRGADIHQVVVDARGATRGAILWECKNARNWSDGWIAKLKADQRSLHADVAVLVTTRCRKTAAASRSSTASSSPTSRAPARSPP